MSLARPTTLFLSLLTSVLLAASLLAPPAVAQEGPETNRASDNVTFVAHDQYPSGTDLFFQRREGEQTLDGQTVTGTRDYLFAGADATGAAAAPEDTFVGVRVYDVTDPTDPQLIAGLTCGGYHADVAVYENLLLQGIDSAGTNDGCPESMDPEGVDQAEVAGLRIFDITDPANPIVVGFVTAEDLGGSSVHNVTTLPWAGVAYVAGSHFTDPSDIRLPIVDLTDPEFPVTNVPMRDISSTAEAECHDIGLDPVNELAFCAAVTQTFVWDVSDPFAPAHVSAITNPNINIHHAARLAPDGTTLVLNDELGGAAVSFGCAPTTQDTLGALWFYDISDPASPALQGAFSTSEASLETPCTSHFYNFVPGTTLLAVGWYKSGMIVVDYEDPAAATEHAVYEPVGGDFWAAYYWNGLFFGSSFGGEGTPDYGGDFESAGLWVIDVEGTPTVDPAVQDQGTSWAPWTPPAAPADDEPADGAPADDEVDGAQLPATGGGALPLLLGLSSLALGWAGLRRRRG